MPLLQFQWISIKRLWEALQNILPQCGLLTEEYNCKLLNEFSEISAKFSYKERCSLLDMLPLCYRREICDLKLLFKSIMSMYVPSFCDVTANIVKPTVPNVRLRANDNDARIKAYHFKTETYKHYFTKTLFYQYDFLSKYWQLLY